jgi:hypothetical protein
MSWLRKPVPPPGPPVRADQVRRIVAALRAEDDAILFDEGPSGHCDFQRARAVLGAVCRNATDAEIQAAYRAVAGD